jgi:hypothetical protein
MTLTQAWIDSLMLLRTKNFLPFTMATLKSIQEAYKLVFKYFWWLVLVCFIISSYRILIVNSRDMSSLVLYAQIRGIVYLLYTLLFMGVCFVTRPSIEKKDCAYLVNQYKKIILYWVTWAIIFVVSSGTLLFMPSFYVTLCSVVYIFTILFFADSQGSFKDFLFSICNALKMIIFNIPLLFVIGSFFYCSEWFFFQCIKRGIIFFVSEENVMTQTFIVVRIINNFLGVLLMPIGVCTYANIYIKKLHDQFDLYFK